MPKPERSTTEEVDWSSIWRLQLTLRKLDKISGSGLPSFMKIMKNCRLKLSALQITGDRTQHETDLISASILHDSVLKRKSREQRNSRWWFIEATSMDDYSARSNAGSERNSSWSGGFVRKKRMRARKMTKIRQICISILLTFSASNPFFSLAEKAPSNQSTQPADWHPEVIRLRSE